MNAATELLRLRVNSLAAELEFTAARHAVARAAASKGDEVAGILDFPLIDTKSLSQDTMLDDHMRIEGRAANYDVDRQDEAFLPGVLEAGLKAWISRGGILLWHHKPDQAMGVVEDARIDSKGIWIRGRLDDPTPGTPLADVWNKVRSGTIRSLSVGGYFKRKMTPQGQRIYKADIVECSLTPTPVNPECLFTVVSGKAIGSDAPAAQLAKLAEVVERVGGLVAAL